MIRDHPLVEFHYLENLPLCIIYRYLEIMRRDEITHLSVGVWLSTRHRRDD